MDDKGINPNSLGSQDRRTDNSLGENEFSAVARMAQEIKLPDLIDVKLAMIENWESDYLKAFETLNVEEIQTLVFRKTEVGALLHPTLKQILFSLWKNDFESVNQYLRDEIHVPLLEEEHLVILVFLLLSHHCPFETMVILEEKRIDLNITFEHGVSPLIYAALSGRLDILLVCYQHLPGDLRAKLREYILTIDNESKVDTKIGTCDWGRTALIYAARGQSEECVLFLLNRGFSACISDINGVTPLMCAAQTGGEGCVRLLLKHGADVLCKTKLGVTALMLAAVVGNVSCVNLLIENGAKVKDADLSGMTVLMYAVKGDYQKCVETILQHGADINHVDSTGNSALMHAVQTSYMECCKILVENSVVDASLKNKEGHSALLLSVVCGHLEPLDLLLENDSSDINERDPDGRTALHIAATHGHINCLRFFLRHGADLDLTDNRGDTALSVAVFNGHHECERAIVNRSILSGDISLLCIEPNEDCISAMMLMSQAGRSLAVEDMISKGDDIHYLDKLGRNALMFAVRGDSVDCLHLLLKKGADVNVVDQDGFSALMLAAAMNYSQCLGLLLRHGANLDLSDKNGMTATMMAASRGCMEALHLLVHCHPQQVAHSPNGCTLLMYAICGGNFGCVDFLLNKGYPVTDVDRIGKTIMMQAVQGKNSKIMTAVLEQGCSVDDASHDHTTGLMCSAFKGSLNGVEFLLMHGANVHARNDDGLTALLYSALGKSFPCTSLLIDAGSDVNAIEKTGNTTIKFAAQMGQPDSVKLLLAHPEGVTLVHDDESSAALNALAGCNAECLSLILNKMASNGDVFDPSLVFYAARQGCIESLRVLLDFPQYDHNDVDSVGMSVLMHAAAGGSVECVELLCEKEVDLEHRDQSGKTAILCACQCGQFRCVEYLLRKGAFLDALDDSGASALMYAAGSGKELCVEFILEHITNVNTIDSSGFNALIYAIIGKNVNCLEALLIRGIDKDNKDSRGMSTFLYAAHRGARKFLECLLENGSQIDEVNNVRQTALMMAATEGRDDCIICLLEHGADLNAMDRFGKNSLMYAAENGRDASTNLLLDAGSKINQRDARGNTALLCAIEDAKLSCARILLERGAYANVTGANMKSALMHCCCVRENSPHEFVELLLLYNASVNGNDMDGKTALMYAATHGRVKCVQLLIDHIADVSMVDVRGESVLTYAAAQQDPACLAIIMNTEYYQIKSKQILESYVRRAFVYASQRCLRVMVKYGYFKWEWLCQFNLVSLQSLGRVAVTMNIHPGEFSVDGQQTTLLQFALGKNELSTVKYLLANLYLAGRDLKYFSENPDLISSLKISAHFNDEMRALPPGLVSTPWNLQALCLLTISGCIAANGTSPFCRKELVDRLPVPDMIKGYLNFERPIAKLCPHAWDQIELRCTEQGQPENDLLAMSMRKQAWLHPPVNDSCCPDCVIDN